MSVKLRSGATSKVIDFRVRPPLLPFKVLYDLKLFRLTWENKFMVGTATSPSMYKVGVPEGLELLKLEMDEAGVDSIVIPGRRVSAAPAAVAASGTTEMIVSDEALLGLQKTFDNRAYGLHGFDLDLPTDEAIAGFEQAIVKHGLRGGVIEPGYFKAADGSVLNADDEKLYPIYETAIKHDAFIMHQSGIYAGPDIGVNDWAPLDRALQRFPKLKMLLAHGGYPAVIDSCALVTKHPNLYISPDIYCRFPGGSIYVEAISMLPDQFIHASAFPLGAIKEAVDATLQFPLSDDVMQKYLYGNAAKLLKLE